MDATSWLISTASRVQSLVFKERVTVFPPSEVVHPTDLDPIKMLRSDLVQVIEAFNLSLHALVSFASHIARNPMAPICNRLALAPFFEILGKF